MKDILIIKSHIDFRKAISELFFSGHQTEIEYNLHMPLPKKTIHKIAEWVQITNNVPGVYSYKICHISKYQYIKLYTYESPTEVRGVQHLPFVEIRTNVCDVTVYLKHFYVGSRINYDLTEWHIAKLMEPLGYNLEFVLEFT